MRARHSLARRWAVAALDFLEVRGVKVFVKAVAVFGFPRIDPKCSKSPEGY
jgi:hypothetical protein